MAVALNEWTALIAQEYLADFIPSGGAAVKIAVTETEGVPAVIETVAQAGEAHGHIVARVDAASVRLYMIDKVFHAVAQQIDWDDLTARRLRRLLQDNGIEVEPDRPLHDVEGIANANGRTRQDLMAEINRLIANRILKDYALAKEFRTAMAMLCWGLINPQNVTPTDADLVKRWLTGERANLAQLKRVQIYQKIGRHNARLLLGALAVWMRQVGHSGLTLLLDMNAVVSDDAPRENLVRYTRAGVLDTYEVLRQFIDDTDEMAHLLVVAVAGLGFLESQKRNVDNYTALKLRTSDEVRDQTRANPLNAMVRLSVREEGNRAAIWNKKEKEMQDSSFDRIQITPQFPSSLPLEGAAHG
jgi:hypothetical protein